MNDDAGHDMSATPVKDTALRINRNPWIEAFLKLAGILLAAIIAYVGATGNAWLKTQISDQVQPLSAQISELSQQIKPIQETLKAAAEKDRANDILMNESRQRLALIESNMARGRAERDRQMSELLDAIREVRATQLESAKALAGLLAIQAQPTKGR